MVALAATHRGCTSAGHDFVSDGSLLILAELVTLSSFGGYVQIPSAALDAMVSRPPFLWCPLHSLVPSPRRADVFWAPGDVALSDRYLGLLRALDRPIELGPSGPKDPVLLKEGDIVIGVLMPLDYPPESPVAPPEPQRAAPVPPPEPQPAAPAPAPLHLERFEVAARKIVAAAQALADQRGHVNMEPLHIAVRLVERDIDPARSRIPLQIAEQSLARLPKAPVGEASYLSPSTLALLAEVDRIAEGRPVAVPDLWRAIRRQRGSSAAIVLEASSPD